MKKILCMIAMAFFTSGVYAQTDNKKVYYTIDGETGELVRVEPLQQEVKVIIENQPSEEIYYYPDKPSQVIETVSNVLQTVAITGAAIHLLKHGPHHHYHRFHHHHKPVVPHYYKPHLIHKPVRHKLNRRR